MKSIKEKSNEYAKEYLFSSIQRTPNIHFEAGANYVIDEIEKLTNHQNWCAFPKQSHKELKELIEQLKK